MLPRLSPTLYFLLALALCLAHVLDSMARNEGILVPPLDDALIYFRYAHSIAEGIPYQYIPGEAPSSGATSLLWPYLLAIGALRLDGLALYPWALALSVPLFAWSLISTSAWVERLSSPSTGTLAALALFLCGPYAWGMFSGMEIPLVAAALCAAIDALTDPKASPLKKATLLALLSCSRPEGPLMAGSLALIPLVKWWQEKGRFPSEVLISPLGFSQILLIRWMTGLWSSSGMLAKQNPRFPMVGEDSAIAFAWDSLLWKVYGEHFFGMIGPLFIAVFAIGTIWLLQKQRILGIALLLCWAWPIIGQAATVHIHAVHGRYMMPTLAIYMPLLVLGLAAIDAYYNQNKPWANGTLLASMVFNTASWIYITSLNAEDIRLQHVNGAAWIERNLPPGAVIAVNDAGFVAALTDHPMIDLEGIVTMRTLPKALKGEGSLFSIIRDEKPPYFAIYPMWFPSLGKAGALEIIWSARLEQRTIAGGATMIIAKLKPEVLDAAERLPPLAPGEKVLDLLDVSDLESEAAHQYQFDDRLPWAGRANTILNGNLPDGTHIVEGARRHQQPESFILQNAKRATRLVARLGWSAGPLWLKVTAGGKTVDWKLPPIAEDTWQEVGIPVESSSDSLEVRIEPVEIPVAADGGWRVGRWWLVGPE
jgi:hypothetical protein